MNRQELTDLLQKLQSALEAGPAVDEGLKASLRQLDHDIQTLLTPDNTAAATDAGSLNERAQELEARFETEHPVLASTLRDVMDTLGKMGI
jgi:hypothetical protein